MTLAELNHYMGTHLIAEGDLENGLPLLEISVKILRALADKLAPDEES